MNSLRCFSSLLIGLFGKYIFFIIHCPSHANTLYFSLLRSHLPTQTYAFKNISPFLVTSINITKILIIVITATKKKINELKYRDFLLL